MGGQRACAARESTAAPEAACPGNLYIEAARRDERVPLGAGQAPLSVCGSARMGARAGEALREIRALREPTPMTSSSLPK